MPYKIFEFEEGYKVGKKDGSRMRNGRKFASNKFLTLERAKSQMKALYASEKNKK